MVGAQSNADHKDEEDEEGSVQCGVEVDFYQMKSPTLVVDLLLSINLLVGVMMSLLLGR